MMMKKILLAVLFKTILSGTIIGQIITDRPDQTESSSTVGKGNLQLETGMLLDIEGENQFSTRHFLAPATLFRYGVLNGAELRISSQLETQKTDGQSIRGISDIEVGVKIQLLNNESRNT
jgi:hypothetical protein